MTTTGRALQRWQEVLEAWRPPDSPAAPEPSGTPVRFPVEMMARHADWAAQHDTPTHQRCRESLPRRGTLLDVGCGVGAGSLPVAPPCSQVVGVDADAAMLEAFADRAGELGVAVDVVHGSWPDCADAVEPADVVVCRRVLYLVRELDRFLRALAAHARRRVVIEVHDVIPTYHQRHLWRQFHDLMWDNPPTVAHVTAVLDALAIPYNQEQWTAPADLHALDDASRLRFLRQRLLLPVEREAEIAEVLTQHPPPAAIGMHTLWWDVAATASE